MQAARRPRIFCGGRRFRRAVRGQSRDHAPTYAEASAADAPGAPRKPRRRRAVRASASHMLNDMMQSLAPALYPVFREQFSLTFFQIGIITFVFQLTASLLQPIIGLQPIGGR